MGSAEATPQEKRRLAGSLASLDRLIGQFRSQRLIDFLSSQSWLPGYAFPQNVVKLLVRHAELNEKMRLERDRELGISEYAPGSEIVADGHLLRSGAVGFNSKGAYRYAFTRAVRSAVRSQSSWRPKHQQKPVTAAGPMSFVRPNALSSQTLSARFPRTSRGSRDSSADARRAIQMCSCWKARRSSTSTRRSPASPTAFAAMVGCSAQIPVIASRASRSAASAGVGLKSVPPIGLIIRHGVANAGGQLLDLHLAHELKTDILQLRFDHCSPPAPKLDDKVFWQSFEAAFPNGCCDELESISTTSAPHLTAGPTKAGWASSSSTTVYRAVQGTSNASLLLSTAFCKRRWNELRTVSVAAISTRAAMPVCVLTATNSAGRSYSAGR